MRGERRRSTTDEVVLRAEVVLDDDDYGWRCRKHTSQPRYGVCPGCLRERLLLLCPDCATLRPCACFVSSSSSSSFSSSYGADIPRSGGGGMGVGMVGSVFQLIEREPPFRRSRSVGVPFIRSRSVTEVPFTPKGGGMPTTKQNGRSGWASLWPFRRARAERNSDSTVASATTIASEMNLPRSRSVAVSYFPDSGVGQEGKGKGWRWYFPSPMKAFRDRKSPSYRW